MTLGQRFDPKGSSYSTLAVNQNTLIFFFYTYITLEFSPINNIPNTTQKQQDILIIITVQNKSS